MQKRFACLSRLYKTYICHIYTTRMRSTGPTYKAQFEKCLAENPNCHNNILVCPSMVPKMFALRMYHASSMVPYFILVTWSMVHFWFCYWGGCVFFFLIWEIFVGYSRFLGKKFPTLGTVTPVERRRIWLWSRDLGNFPRTVLSNPNKSGGWGLPSRKGHF